MSNTNFVIDFETMGSDPSSVVLSCAVTFFDRNQDYTFQDYVDKCSYYWKFDIEHQIAMGRTICPNTLKWWGKQDPDVKKSQLEPTDNDWHLKDFVENLKIVLDQEGAGRDSLAYCRGQSFDFPILTNIFKSVMKEIDSFYINPAFFPVAFWNQRDIRSYLAGLLCDPTKIKCPVPKGELDGFKHHDPVHDCARAVVQLLYAEGYATGEIDVPDEIDENSFK